MKNAIVTVTDRAHSYAYDMEFPSDIGGDRLVPFLFQALREIDPALEYDAGTYGIYLQRAKHFVNSHQTFAQAGGRNGDILLVVDMNPGRTSFRRVLFRSRAGHRPGQGMGSKKYSEKRRGK